MGISGLLQVLRDVMDPVSVETLRGKTAAIDAFSWLHKGVYSCSTDLCLGKPTKAYVKYIMDKLRLLQHLGVIPYMVFDGDYLPMKAGKEQERALSRKSNLEKGLRFLKDGNSRAAHNCFVKAVDVTPAMAFDVIKLLREQNIKYIVAPYEADAQLAWLCQNGLADFVISEDSDCIPFGCQKVFFKMDRAGYGLLYNAKNLASCEKLNFLNWSHDMLLDMCILAGCDYLPSIKGMGVVKAHGLVAKHKTPDRIFRALRFTGALRIPAGYESRFNEARLTFLHQRVFNPVDKEICTLLPLSEDCVARANNGAPHKRCPRSSPKMDLNSKMDFLGPLIEHEIALAVALGEVHPTTKQPFATASGSDDGNLTSEQRERAQKIQEALAAAKAPKGPATAAQCRAFFASAKRRPRKRQTNQTAAATQGVGSKVFGRYVAAGSARTKRAPGVAIGERLLASYSLENTSRVAEHVFRPPRLTMHDGVKKSIVSSRNNLCENNHTPTIRGSSSKHLQNMSSVAPKLDSGNVSPFEKPALCTNPSSAASTVAGGEDAHELKKSAAKRSKYFAEESSCDNVNQSQSNLMTRDNYHTRTNPQHVPVRTSSNVENMNHDAHALSNGRSIRPHFCVPESPEIALQKKRHRREGAFNKDNAGKQRSCMLGSTFLDQFAFDSSKNKLSFDGKTMHGSRQGLQRKRRLGRKGVKTPNHEQETAIDTRKKKTHGGSSLLQVQGRHGAQRLATAQHHLRGTQRVHCQRNFLKDKQLSADIGSSNILAADSPEIAGASKNGQSRSTSRAQHSVSEDNNNNTSVNLLSRFACGVGIDNVR